MARVSFEELSFLFLSFFDILFLYFSLFCLMCVVIEGVNVSRYHFFLIFPIFHFSRNCELFPKINLTKWGTANNRPYIQL